MFCYGQVKEQQDANFEPSLGFQDFFQKHVAGKIVDPAK